MILLSSVPWTVKLKQDDYLSKLIFTNGIEPIITGQFGCTISNSTWYNRRMQQARKTWSNQTIGFINKYRQRVHEVEAEAIRNRLLARESNLLSFYNIAPKEDLPKCLQNVTFQTLHVKEKDVDKSVKIFHKENRKPKELLVRKRLKEEGNIMLLSEIYHYLGQTGEAKRRGHKVQESCSDLEEWEKNKQLRNDDKEESSSAKLAKLNENRLMESGGDKNHLNEKHLLSQLKAGKDQKMWVEKGLEIIEMSHENEVNSSVRYSLIENSSKLLKKEIDAKKAELEGEIKASMELVVQARTRHHGLFEKQQELLKEAKVLKEQLAREQASKPSYKSTANIRDKNNELRLENSCKLTRNEEEIDTIKITIDSLEAKLTSLQEQHQKWVGAEQCYYRLSLKKGVDCRQSGLGWIIRKLNVKEEDIPRTVFPDYLDKRSRLFLVQKAANEEELQALLEKKSRFINQIGRASRMQTMESGKSKVKDRVLEHGVMSDVNFPKRYRKSLKQINLLNEEYEKNWNLLEYQQRDSHERSIEISSDLEGLNNKQIYASVGSKIKKLDLCKLKRDRVGYKKKKLLEYQSLLERIKLVHIRAEEQDLQHESHLLSHYKDNRQLFFTQAAACFGYKKAYSMIIKHFSWKNYRQP